MTTNYQKSRGIGARLAALALSVVAIAATGVASAHAAAAISYYASPTGTGDCRTYNTACSLETARDLVRTVNDNMTGSITVNILNGTYRLGHTFALTAADSGSNGHRVIWQAYPGHKPLISGARIITGWQLTNAAEGIYSAPAASLDTRQLYVDGVRAIRARSTAGIPGTVTQTTAGYTTTDTAMQSWANPQDLEFVYTGNTPANIPKKWTESRCGVASITGTSSSTTITMDQPCYSNARARSVLAPHYFENNYALLDEPGEWYLDRAQGRVHYIPRAGENMSTARVAAAELQTLMTITGTLDAPVHDITVSGLRFSYNSWLQANTTNGFVEKQANVYWMGTARTETKTPSSVMVTSGHRITFQDNTFRHLGSGALDFSNGAKDNIVVGNIFTDISASGLTIGDPASMLPSDTRAINSGNQVLNNWFHHMPREYHGGVAILQFYARDSLISHNQINDLSYTGISTGWDHTNAPSVIENNRVTNNLVFNDLQLLADGGGIYNLGRQGTSLSNGLLITGNVVHHQFQRLAALYTDDGSQFITMRNNVLLDNFVDWGGCKPVGDMVFENNFWQNTKPAWPCDIIPTNLTIANNTVVDSDNLPAAAQAIVDNAGLEPPYEGLLTR